MRAMSRAAIVAHIGNRTASWFKLDAVRNGLADTDS